MDFNEDDYYNDWENEGGATVDDSVCSVCSYTEQDKGFQQKFIRAVDPYMAVSSNREVPETNMHPRCLFEQKRRAARYDANRGY